MQRGSETTIHGEALGRSLHQLAPSHAEVIAFARTIETDHPVPSAVAPCRPFVAYGAVHNGVHAIKAALLPFSST